MDLSNKLELSQAELGAKMRFLIFSEGVWPLPSSIPLTVDYYPKEIQQLADLFQSELFKVEPSKRYELSYFNSKFRWRYYF